MNTTQTSLSRSPEAYFKDRVEYKINLYMKLAMRHKWLYWLMTSISLVCAVLVPILINNQCVCDWIPTILSLVVTILLGLQGIFHPREHWRNYDMISATLRREEMLFSTDSGEYELLKGDKKFRLFVKRIEDFIAREREETIIMRTSEKQSDLNNDVKLDSEIDNTK